MILLLGADVPDVHDNISRENIVEAGPILMISVLRLGMQLFFSCCDTLNAPMFEGQDAEAAAHSAFDSRHYSRR